MKIIYDSSLWSTVSTLPLCFFPFGHRPWTMYTQSRNPVFNMKHLQWLIGRRGGWDKPDYPVPVTKHGCTSVSSCSSVSASCGDWDVWLNFFLEQQQTTKPQLSWDWMICFQRHYQYHQPFRLTELCFCQINELLTPCNVTGTILLSCHWWNSFHLKYSVTGIFLYIKYSLIIRLNDNYDFLHHETSGSSWLDWW